MLLKGDVMLGIAILLSVFIWNVSAQNQASFAVNLRRLPSAVNPIIFDDVLINRGNALNASVGHLNLLSTGLYLITMSAGNPGNGQTTNYQVRHLGHFRSSVFRSPWSNAGEDTMGMDLIHHYSAGDYLNMANEGGRLESTFTGYHTSWGTFSLSTEMATAVGFSVFRTSSHQAGNVIFTHIWANVGNRWNNITQGFEVSQTGIYFFSFATGLGSGDPANYNLQINGINVFNIYRSFGTPTSFDTIGRAAMIQLYSGERVTMYSTVSGYSGGVIYTNFNGFLYNTARDKRAAWAAYRTTGISGAYDPLPFTDVLVNEGGVWLDDRAWCPIAGIYYVHVSVGLQPGTEARVVIMRDSTSVGEIRRENTLYTGIDTLSRSVLVECNAGESIRVITSIESELYSDSYYQIGFLGFYVFQ